MRRVFVAPQAIEEGRARLDAAARHHLTAVLRLGPGDAVEVFDGEGRAWSGVLRTDGDVDLGEVRTLAGAPPITLGQALAREKLDLVVQKATELGARRIALVVMERSVVKLDPERAGDRARRLQRIATEAARQCGRADVPEVEGPFSLQAFVESARSRGDALAVLWEGEAPRLSSWLVGQEGSIALLVGPEGGIAPGEREVLRGAGAAEVSLGPRILRTETAGLAALAVALHLRGELG